MQKRPIYPIHPGEILADELCERCFLDEAAKTL